MVTNFETVEERIRNAVTPMYNLAHIIKDIRNDENNENSEILKNFLLNKADINIILKNIEYLINVGHEVDKVLPKDYSINDHLKRENDQKNNKYNLTSLEQSSMSSNDVKLFFNKNYY